MPDDHPKPDPTPQIIIQPGTCGVGHKCKAPAHLSVAAECGQVQRLLHEAFAAGVEPVSLIRARVFGLQAYAQAQSPSRN